ncbi:MAG: TMEM175 family protein [Edaphobacter sp.]
MFITTIHHGRPTLFHIRLEAFSDGVIAVIITIMVLELKVPRQNGFAGLRAIVPTLAIYLISFSLTAIYWINHHHLVRRIDQADERVLYANLSFLFCLSLLPFFTSYVLEKENDAFSIALYAASMVITGFGFLLLRLAIDRRLRISGALRQVDTSAQRKHLLSLVLYGIAIPLAYYRPWLAMADIALVTIVWIIPTAGTKPCDEETR